MISGLVALTTLERPVGYLFSALGGIALHRLLPMAVDAGKDWAKDIAREYTEHFVHDHLQGLNLHMPHRHEHENLKTAADAEGLTDLPKPTIFPGFDGAELA